MPMHLLAFSGAKTDSVANEAAPAPQDNVFTRTASGNTVLVPRPMTALYAAAFNDTITRARLNYPSYRDIGLPEIFPVNALAIPSANFFVANWGWNGPRIRATEELGIDSSNGASTVDIINACVLLGDAPAPVPSGRRFTVRGTAAQTLVANQWTAASITLDQTLPYGTYAVIGFAGVCAAAYAARLIFPNGQLERPGLAIGNTAAIHEFEMAGRAGEWGEWGRFVQTAPPMMEVLGTTAGAQTPVAILDLVQLTGMAA